MTWRELTAASSSAAFVTCVAFAVTLAECGQHPLPAAFGLLTNGLVMCALFCWGFHVPPVSAWLAPNAASKIQLGKAVDLSGRLPGADNDQTESPATHAEKRSAA